MKSQFPQLWEVPATKSNKRFFNRLFFWADQNLSFSFGKISRLFFHHRVPALFLANQLIFQMTFSSFWIDLKRGFVSRRALFKTSAYFLRTTSTSSQCYKQVCKNRPIFKTICGHKWCLIQNYHAFLQKNLVFKSGNRHQHIEFDNTWG